MRGQFDMKGMDVTPYQLIQEGGSCMIVLFALSLAALTEIIYSLVVLRRRVLLPPSLVTLTDENDVCRRADESYGEMRTRRCTPVSDLSQP